MNVINLSQQPTLLNRFVSELRNIEVQTDPLRFRRNLERIGEVMAFEISKELEYSTENIKTPLGSIDIQMPQSDIIIASIFRAGLPFHQGFLNYFDRAENAFVSAFRKYTNNNHDEFVIHTEYVATPSLEGKTLLIVDPMLATGRSLESVLHVLLEYGTPKRIHLASIIAAEAGVHFVQQFEKYDVPVTLWCAAIDPILDEHSYIVPGLGDCGDLAYGPKL